MYPRAMISEEMMLDLCDSYLFRSQSDFENELNNIMDYAMMKCAFVFDEDKKKMRYSVHTKLDDIYLALERNTDSSIETYRSVLSKLETNIQRYSVPFQCDRCDRDWKECCNNAEFYGLIIYDCLVR